MDKLKKLYRKAFKLIKANKKLAAIGAGVIVVIIVGIILACTLGGKKEATSGAETKFKVNNNDELTGLILNYYYAYSSGDIAGVETYATPVSDEEKSYIEFYSQYIDAFENVKLYTKPGLDDGSYLVSAYVDLKFAGIDKAAPGLDFFYVRTNDDGNLYIDNLYGSFNQSNNINEMEPEVTTLIAKFEQQQDVIELQEDVQKKCDDALDTDEVLAAFVNNTLSEAIITWSTSYKEEEARKAEEAAAAAEEQARKEAEAAAEASAYYGKTTDTINVRSLASKDGAKIGQISAGERVKIYTKEGDFYQIEFDNRKAYVAAQYVKIEENTSSNESSSSSSNSSSSNSTSSSSTSSSTSSEKVTVTEKKPYYMEGDKVTVKDSYKVYDSMMDDAKSVGTVHPGDVLTVRFCYEEGYTSIKCGDIAGYIKTKNIN